MLKRLALASLLLLAGCAVQQPSQQTAPAAAPAPPAFRETEMTAPKAPPADKVEKIPPAPHAVEAMQWRPGRWHWDGRAFTWETGEWIDRPSKSVLWSPGK